MGKEENTLQWHGAQQNFRLLAKRHKDRVGVEALVGSKMEPYALSQCAGLPLHMVFFQRSFAGDPDPVRHKIPRKVERRRIGSKQAGKRMVREKVHEALYGFAKAPISLYTFLYTNRDTMANLRTSDTTHKNLKEISVLTGFSMQAILDQAVAAYRDNLFLERLNDDFATLRSQPDAWQEELDERALWEQSLRDGLLQEERPDA